MIKVYNVENLSVVQERKKKEKQSKETVPLLVTDVADVGETTAYVLMDSMTTAETVAFLLLEIEELKAEIAALKGGNE